MHAAASMPANPQLGSPFDDHCLGTHHHERHARGKGTKKSPLQICPGFDASDEFPTEGPELMDAIDDVERHREAVPTLSLAIVLAHARRTAA
jgi:hypothetical protein